MKKIVSVSLGSSKRDHEVEVKLLDEVFNIKRIGTDGDFKQAIETLEKLDGNVDAIGLGGIDIYIYSKTNRYALRDGLKLKDAVKITPVVDGSGLKNTLEKEVVRYIEKSTEIKLSGKKVLMVSAMDRFGMAEALSQAGCEVIYGDFIFALGIDKAIMSLEELEKYADKLLPEVVKLPIGFLYPIGKSQEKVPEEKYTKYYDHCDIIAGDFHFIKKFMPKVLKEKIILTNTVTSDDVEDLKKRGVKFLITTTPEFSGRSFGTNVLEAVFISIIGKNWDEIKEEDYLELIKKLNFKPRIEKLN